VRTVAVAVTAARAELVIAKIANAVIAARRMPLVVARTVAVVVTDARAELVIAKIANAVIAVVDKEA